LGKFTNIDVGSWRFEILPQRHKGLKVFLSLKFYAALPFSIPLLLCGGDIWFLSFEFCILYSER
jgi:hypothetical protein